MQAWRGVRTGRRLSVAGLQLPVDAAPAQSPSTDQSLRASARRFNGIPVTPVAGGRRSLRRSGSRPATRCPVQPIMQASRILAPLYATRGCC